eukprot:scaffold316258_cov32-Tisochrysis_lutea.AAC.2
MHSLLHTVLGGGWDGGAGGEGGGLGGAGGEGGAVSVVRDSRVDAGAVCLATTHTIADDTHQCLWLRDSHLAMRVPRRAWPAVVPKERSARVALAGVLARSPGADHAVIHAQSGTIWVLI